MWSAFFSICHRPAGAGDADRGRLTGVLDHHPVLDHREVRHAQEGAHPPDGGEQSRLDPGGRHAAAQGLLPEGLVGVGIEPVDRARGRTGGHVADALRLDAHGRPWVEERGADELGFDLPRSLGSADTRSDGNDDAALDQDGDVEFDDVLIVLAAWGPCS